MLKDRIGPRALNKTSCIIKVGVVVVLLLSTWMVWFQRLRLESRAYPLPRQWGALCALERKKESGWDYEKVIKITPLLFWHIQHFGVVIKVIKILQ